MEEQSPARERPDYARLRGLPSDRPRPAHRLARAGGSGCARLESLTKDYDCVAIISLRAAEAAGLEMSDRELHDAPLKGRAEPVQFYALKTLADLAI